jgi:flagellar biosynthesis/type III secretory pathway protein FliH
MTAKEISDLFVQLELHLIASLKRNLMRHRKQEQDEGGTGNVPEYWEAWQSAKLRDIRRFRRENEKILEQYSSVINAETESLLQEQYAEGGSDGFFHTSDERLRSLIHEMQNNEARVERAALRYMNDVYRKTILRTATAMNAGGMTYQQATDEATKDFLAQGINCVVYANGRQVNIASYAEMALRTCATRAMLLGEGKQREKLGIDTVLVSQYGACSDTCLPWQGRVYIDDVFQPYYGDSGGSFAVSRNGRQYMRLSIAIQGGLFHPNCRHTISTWFEGISTMPAPMDPAKIEKVSKLEKQQRALERQVRRAKREAAGLTDETARKEAKARVRKAQEELRSFIKENSDVLRRDYWRERDTKVPVDWGASSGVSESTVPYGKSVTATSDKSPAKVPVKFVDITGKWYSDAVPNSHPVLDLHTYTVNGVSYEVDGHNVVLDYSAYEKEIAELLEREVGGELFMVPRVNNPQGVSTPDYLFHGKGYDLKTLGKDASENTLFNRVKKSRKQANNFVIDVSNSNLDDKTIDAQINRIFNNPSTIFVDEIIIIRSGKIIKVAKRA